MAFARTLCSSFLEFYPEGKCYVLIIDNIDGYIDPEKENFELVNLSDLKILNLREFCFKYNVVELATACKPYLLKYLLDSKSLNKLLYLDPDILITNRLDNLYEDLDKNDFIITPHLDKDYPDDGLLPNDATILKYGIFNLGFIGVRKCENASQFLLWWQHKLYNKCLMHNLSGYFVDQKFINLAITLFKNYKIIPETGYNVAFWNLHSRSIIQVEREWRCNGEKLYFYHFSGYKPENPERISLHQTRHKFEDSVGLRLLFQEYRERLIKCGYLESYKWPYSHNYFNNGYIVNDFIRWVYLHRLAEKGFSDPFDISKYTIGYRILFMFLILGKKCTSFILKIILWIRDYFYE